MQNNAAGRNSDITEIIIGCCYDIMNELGVGFLESVYKNALIIALQEKGLKVEVEKRYTVEFRGRKIGIYIADIVVNNSVVVELKCCEKLSPDHLSQLINYLKASGILIGVLVNFGNKKVDIRRLQHPAHYSPYVVI